jgi:hypothetical protein
MTNWGEGTEPKTAAVHIPLDLHRTFKSICARKGLKIGAVLAGIVAEWIMRETAKEANHD